MIYGGLETSLSSSSLAVQSSKFSSASLYLASHQRNLFKKFVSAPWALPNLERGFDFGGLVP